MVTCFECDNDRSKIDDRSLNSPINRFRFGSWFSARLAPNVYTDVFFLFVLQGKDDAAVQAHSHLPAPITGEPSTYSVLYSPDDSDAAADEVITSEHIVSQKIRITQGNSVKSTFSCNHELLS